MEFLRGFVEGLRDSLLYPAWYRQARDTFQAYADSNARLIARMDQELAAMRNSTPPPPQGIDPFLPEVTR